MWTVACATSPAPTQTASGLSQVRVESDGDASVVVLEGTADAVAQAYQEEDPARVVVHLAGIAAGANAGAIAVYDGTIDEIMVSDTGGGTRVEIALGTVATFEVVPGAGSVRVRVVRQDTASMGAADGIESADVDDPWATVSETPAPIGADTELRAADPDEMPIAAEAPAAPATTLTAVWASASDEGVLVELGADGAIGDVRQFVLESPLRMVLDLPGLASEAPASNPVNGALVSRIRVGQHEDKVRVVIDAADGVQSFGETGITTTATGMALGLGGALAPTHAAGVASSEEAAPEATLEALDLEPVQVTVARVALPTPDAPAAMDEEAAFAGPDEASAVAEAPSSDVTVAATAATGTDDLATTDVVAEETAAVPAARDEEASADAAAQVVYGVQLDTGAQQDRVVIVTDGPADYVTMTPDPETVIVQLRGAVIDEAASARISPEQPGVVSMVAAFDLPDVAEPEVRVVIQRAAGAVPTITQKGPMLMVDFARTGAHATPIPALTEASADGAAPAAPAAIPASEDAIGILDEGGLVDGKVYTGRRISLDFKDVDIDDVLRLVAEVSDLNVVAGDEVSGSVTIRLVDVPWDQALDVILLTKGLGFVRVGNVLRIAPSELLKNEEEARLQEKRAKEKLEDLVVKLQPVNYADVTEVSKMVKRLLTARGTVDVDARTNTIILKDIAAVIDEATALIKAIDTQTPQVMIEAKIVEANLDFLREIGSSWALGVQQRVDAFDDGSANRSSSTNPDALGGQDFRFRSIPGAAGGQSTNNVVVANPITQLATGAVNLGAFILDERFDVDVQIAAAESHGEGKVISSPRIVTLDNRKASIEQGVSIPFQTFENGDAKLEFIDAVLRLDVTPHITADRSIIMQIEVQRNAPDDSVPTPTGSPAIAKNEAKTETLVRDGQTLVIGGIYVVRTSDRESRVPFLHEIPIIGRAFRNHETRDIRQELLVFVTPRVVVNPELGS